MFSLIRRRATYANVVMTLALVFAMTGGAYAAKKYLITSTKQISPSVLKQLAGKPGANGKDGAPGAQGATGPQGPAGANGKDGVNGVNGKDGAPGAQGTTGPQGPAGTKGAAGQKGDPWTAGGTLPVGSTETGGWAMGNGNSVEGTGVRTAISFTIPLVSALDEEHVQSNPVGFPAGATTEQIENCPGSAAEPKAKSGFLCVYTGIWAHAFIIPSPFVRKLSVISETNVETPGTDTAGAQVLGLAGHQDFEGAGTWAVTG